MQRRGIRLLVLAFIVLLAIAVAWTTTQPSPQRRVPKVVVVTNWFAKGEQFVTFQLDSSDAVLMWSDVVSGSYDGKVRPMTQRSFGNVFPVRDDSETNITLHPVALPFPGSSFGGVPLAYTPGSYTEAFTPSGQTHLMRLGIAYRQNGVGGVWRRVQSAWESKALGAILRPAYDDPYFVTIGPFTNGLFSAKVSPQTNVPIPAFFSKPLLSLSTVETNAARSMNKTPGVGNARSNP